MQLFDGNGDGWLTLYEAQPALATFKDIADADRDSRITTYEYARAKEFGGAVCAACHKQYREGDNQTGFRFKDGVF